LVHLPAATKSAEPAHELASILGYAYALSASDAAHHSTLDGPHRMTQWKSRVREIRTPGSVRAKTEWLS